MSGERVDVVVAGGGLIGIAVARELALAGREVLLLEAERALGLHTSSRNSEVIHAGIYHAPNTLKAQLCVSGRSLLYRLCAERSVPHRRVGKLLVAVDDHERSGLAELAAQASRCGVDDLRALSAEDVHALEPAVSAVEGLLSPSTGIIDSHALLPALRADAEAAGATILSGARALGGDLHGADTIALEVAEDAASATTQILQCRALINAAGHGAIPLARALRGLPPGSVPTAHYAVGHYFALRGPSPFGHLVYPMPQRGSLGVHATLDLAGQCRFGPDIRWCEGVDYRFDHGRERSFVSAVRRFYPDLPEGALVPGQTGVRPKLHGADEPVADFRIDGAAAHGVAGLVNLFGIESPGLTAVLAIAAHVRALL